MAGPLEGVRVVEMAGIGPGPHACMLLSDMGAEVIRVDRTKGGTAVGANPADVMARGRKSIAVDLKHPDGVETVLRLLSSADVLIEGFRPGVMERLGLGPEVCLARNPRLVYGRMTGWGQEGPLAHAAGHDIAYIAITGALDAIGREDTGPVPPLNLLGDFGGGSLYLVVGVLAALVHARSSGQGQVVDAAITDGVISLMSAIHGFAAMGMWRPGRQRNFLDGGAPYYDTYECADGRFVAVGAIEPQFHALFMEKLGLEAGEASFEAQFDSTRWAALKERVRAAFATRTRDEWCEIMEGTDVCFGPVLSSQEAPSHPHNAARRSFVEIDGVLQSAPAPRFSSTPGSIQGSPPAVGQHTDEVLAELGLGPAAIAALKQSGAVRSAD